MASEHANNAKELARIRAEKRPIDIGKTIEHTNFRGDYNSENKVYPDSRNGGRCGVLCVYSVPLSGRAAVAGGHFDKGGNDGAGRCDQGTVITGTYEIDRAKFIEALALFRQDNFVASRDLFQKADPEQRDASTQYYIAYTYYRQGWGRLSNDDELFAAGLRQLDVVDKLDANFAATDADLKLKRPAELRHELEEGMRVTVDDFNPLKLVRERK